MYSCKDVYDFGQVYYEILSCDAGLYKFRIDPLFIR